MLAQATPDSPPLFFVDFGIAAVSAVVAFGWPLLGAGLFDSIERKFAQLASRKLLAVALVGVGVILLRIVILPFYGVPLPFNVDDFSFLLSADTFAHGRLTNPTPLMWTHFETIHVTMVPSYQSMYFPGQGLLMAASQVLLGHPWWGVLLSSALMCAALTWALQAWIPANWALLGGVIALLRLGLFSYWTNTYQAAGSLAALGGALVVGALPRLKRTSKMHHGLLMAIGIVILELSRPFEGLLLCIPVLIDLLLWTWRGKNRPALAVLARRAVLPLGVIALGTAWLGYYDLKAFGKITTLPYTADRAQYAVAPYYIWQHPRPIPQYRSAMMKRFYVDEEMGAVQGVQTLKGTINSVMQKALVTTFFYAGFMLLLPMLMIRRVLLDRRIRFLLLCAGVLAIGAIIEIQVLPHYEAPFVVVFYAIGLQAMRHLRLCRPEGRPVGLGLVRLTVLGCVGLAGLRVFAQPLHLGAPAWPPTDWYLMWFGPEHYGVQREQIKDHFESLPGPQLVIVRNQPETEASLGDWVHNAADIDGSKVVWARDMGAEENAHLLSYYGNRTAWLVEPDADPVRITPYGQSGPAVASR